MKSPEWFQRWFGEEYKRLYPHRDASQAASQVAAVQGAVRRLAPQFPLRKVLDIGCGTGRHLQAFAASHGSPSSSAFASPTLPTDSTPRPQVYGIDLSAVLLRDARAARHAVTRADMRHLPFADGRFDLVTSFFTSFGYFAEPSEDAATLREFARVVRADGFLFLDLPNKPVVMRELVPTDTLERPGRRVNVTRALEGNVVVKRIRIECTDTEEPSADCMSGADAAGLGLVEHGILERPAIEHHEERVRLYDLQEITPALESAGLEVLHILGDEHGAAYNATQSPRMSLLLRRTSIPTSVREGYTV